MVTVRTAKRHGLCIGSHPGLPDREGFGRREMKLGRDEVAALVLYQTGALKGFAEAEGVSLSHIKPHGSLFGMAQRERHVANGIADAAERLGLPVIAFSDCAMSEVFAERGIAYSCEFYAELDYVFALATLVLLVSLPPLAGAFWLLYARGASA